MGTLEQLSESLIKGQAEEVKKLVSQAIEEKIPVKDILDKGLIAGMMIIGARFKKNEVYVPEVLIAARAMNFGMEILSPLLAEAGVEPVGKIILGTVKGDLHDIGKNLVGMMLKGAGFEVIDLGIDIPSEKFVETAKQSQTKLIALSALLTTTMPAMKDTIEALRQAGLKSVKTIIGGAPVTQEYADEIGADGYAPDAASAVEVSKKLLGI
jgi:5-methyltetrahydrofolate--homocysteine methyltransferase